MNTDWGIAPFLTHRKRACSNYEIDTHFLFIIKIMIPKNTVDPTR